MVNDPQLDKLIDSFERGRATGFALARVMPVVPSSVGSKPQGQFWLDGFQTGHADFNRANPRVGAR